ncbi:MAG: tRNA pseudouridine(38-40) synthase TruA, partial [Bdellovibrionia bacterium]
FEVPPDFHSIHSTIRKTYKYRIFNSPHPTALFHRMTEWVYWPMNVDFLNEATTHILGTHDFTSFQTSGTQRKTTVRTIHYAKWTQKSPHFVEFTITGSGFLKQMVRNIVGTMLDLNRHKRPASEMTKILEARDRRMAGTTAEARGLSLFKVYYPQQLDFKSVKI